MLDTLVNLYARLSSDAYGLYGVLVELVLIGLVVNWCASVLQGTRGTRPLRGVLIILVVTTLVVRSFGWHRLELLYGYVLLGLAFIGLVVFQPELRRAVIRVGDVRFRRAGGSQSQLVAALVKSAGYLSRNRYGALIAIQRNVDLTGWAENGTLINAEVSANLLNTIFFPNSPLHDLGVIIRGNRVVAANCQFPSAESDEIDAALGSRHLAAVGMSYETDALVLVISEETGVVSLADNGRLTRYLSLDDLADELTSRLGGQPAGKGGAGAARPLSVRAGRAGRRLAVVVPLTLMIWYLADQATLSTADLRLQLSVRHVDPRLVVDVEGPRPLVFTGTFSGPVRAISRLEALPQPLDLTWVLPEEYEPGEYALGPEQIRNTIQGLRESGTRGVSLVRAGLRELRFRVEPTVALRAVVRPEGERIRISVESVDPPDVEAVVRRRDLPGGEASAEAVVRARLGKLVQGLLPGEPETLERVPLDRQVVVEGRSEPIEVVRLSPEQVTVRLSVVGEPKRIDNVVVQLLVSPEVLERYTVEQVDLNEWRIGFEVEGAAAVVAALGAHSFDAFAHLTGDMLPPSSRAAEPQLRTLDVLIVPKVRGVTVLGTRSVRVNLVPRPGGGA